MDSKFNSMLIASILAFALLLGLTAEVVNVYAQVILLSSNEEEDNMNQEDNDEDEDKVLDLIYIYIKTYLIYS